MRDRSHLSFLMAFADNTVSGWMWGSCALFGVGPKMWQGRDGYSLWMVATLLILTKGPSPLLPITIGGVWKAGVWLSSTNTMSSRTSHCGSWGPRGSIDCCPHTVHSFCVLHLILYPKAWRIVDPEGSDFFNLLLPWWIHNMMALKEALKSRKLGIVGGSVSQEGLVFVGFHLALIISGVLSTVSCQPWC